MPWRVPSRRSRPEVGAPSFSDMLGQAVNKVHETQQVSSQLASAFEMGRAVLT